MKKFISALAEFIAPAIREITGFSDEISQKVALRLLNDRDGMDELPLPSVMLMDLVGEDTIIQHENSEDEDTKKFIEVWKRRNVV